MDLERSTILAAIANADGNLSRAAKALGCSRRTLQNRMREYGMARGKAGRRKRKLPYGRRSGVMTALGAAVVVGAGFLVSRHLRDGSGNT